MSLPLLRAIASTWPESSIFVVCDPSLWPLLKWGLSSFPRLFWLAPTRGGALASLREQLRQAKLQTGILLTRSLCHAAAFYQANIPCRIGCGNFLGRCFLTDRVVGDPIDSLGNIEHQVDGYRRFLLPLSKVVSIDGPALTIPAKVRHLFLARSIVPDASVLIALVPSVASGVAKRWPLASFRSLALELLKETSATIVFLGKLSHSDRMFLFQGLSHPRIVDLVNQTSLKELALWLSVVKLVVANDSGAMHLADALGTSLVALFGPTSPKRTGPYGVLHGRNRGAILCGLAGCAPCLLKKCPLGGICMNSLSVESVLSWVKIVLEQ